MSQSAKFDLLDAQIRTFNWRNLRHIDWVMALLVLALACIGFAALYSASQNSDSTFPYYMKQIIYFLGGVTVALAIMCIDSRFLVSIAPLLYAGAALLLLAVILFGVTAKGAQRWLPVGPFHLQPSEQTKVIVVYMLAWYLTAVKDRIRRFPYLLLAMIIVAVPAGLIFKQPSLGTALTLVPIGGAMVFAAGCRRLHLVLIVIVGLVAIPVAHGFLDDYQKKRIQSFADPEADPKGSGWQTRQSKITVGSGGISGKGFCQGTQTMLNYLPEHHTDFIFSLLAEEMGFMGALSVIALFAIFLLRGLKFARDCPDMTGTLLGVGAVSILGFHVFVNIAITIGLMPVTGIPLPFLSYGGNFYLTTMICVGMLLNVPVRKNLFE